jgi:ATP-dependent RNA helicase DDX56/DBP9
VTSQTVNTLRSVTIARQSFRQHRARIANMKRKLDENDQPTVEVVATAKITFESFGLDTRLLQAISKERYTKPSAVQAQAIPLVLEGKDVLAKSKTGSGKTAAYVLPILQSVLRKKAGSPKDKTVSALILVPTRELAEQVNASFTKFSALCSKDVRSVNLAQRVSDAVLHALLQDAPDVLVSTPARAIQNLNKGSIDLQDLSHLVIDEADLVLSYGHESDINALAQAVPRGVQTVLMSATLTTEVDTLKGLLCREPVVLKLEDKEENGQDLVQYVVKCGEDEKFLLIYVILKLQLIKGKIIIFVADVDRSYHVKLYLEQFGIKSCVLNSELPVNSRLHAVQEFNRGVYDIIIAADDQEVIGGITTKKGKAKVAEVSEQTYGTDEESDVEPQKKIIPTNKEKDFGVSRGIDFQHVTCVLNFDLPSSAKAYTHRIGRTARAGRSGTALSFIVPAELHGKHKPTTIPSTKHDEKILDRIMTRQAKKGKEVKDYNFDMDQVSAFRYRVNDAMRAITKASVREARTREIKQELLKSEKLKRHFEENPDDLRHLRHDNESRAARVQNHLKHVPDYLMPAKGRKGLTVDEVGFVGVRKETVNRIRKARMEKRMKGKGKGRKRSDPLKSFGKARKP